MLEKLSVVQLQSNKMVLILSTCMLTLFGSTLSCLVTPWLSKLPSRLNDQAIRLRPKYPYPYYNESVPCEISPSLRLYLGSRTYEEFLKSPGWVYQPPTTIAPTTPTTTMTTFANITTTVPRAHYRPTLLDGFLMTIVRIFLPSYMAVNEALQTNPEHFLIPKKQLMQEYKRLPYCPFTYYLLQAKNATKQNNSTET
jgi:hypothetical protein